jgi:superfamily II DNA or RNA helicase
MSGIYMLTHPYESNTYKLGCSENIAQRLKSGDYHRMFYSTNEPQLKGWISVDGYETKSEVLFIEQSIFRQLSHKRGVNSRELFIDVTLEEVANCISNLQLVPKLHNEIPIDNGIKVKKRFNFEKISVKQFQIPILAKMKTYFESNNRGKLILPCGYGKMYLALFLIRDKFDTAVVACPSLLLCQQFTEVARKICPEYSIGLKEGKKWLIITTYHSIVKCNEYNPDLFIVDEAHHTCVTSKSADEESLFRTLLSFPAKKYLFMTATEKVLKQDVKDPVNESREEIRHEYLSEDSDESENDDFTDEDSDESENLEENDKSEKDWYSMDNTELYGNEIYRKNFSEAIEEGIISDYRLVVVNSGNQIEIIYQSQQILGIKRLLTYHNSCESAGIFYQQLNSYGMPAFYMDGNMRMEDRNTILKAFEECVYPAVLCSVDVLAEGISLPFVDSVYFVDPRSSEIDIIQRVGRCLRLHKDKTLATIILPTDILQYTALLRSLVMYDPKSKDCINKKIIGLGFSQDKIRFDDIESNLDVCIMGRLEALWKSKCELSMEYERTFNRSIVRSTKYKGVNLGTWINRQIQAIKGKISSNMNEERLNQLFQLITIQKWNETKTDNPVSIRRSWDNNLLLCFEYERLNNDTVKRRTIYKDAKIGIWLHHQKEIINKYRENENIKYEKLFELKTIKEWYENLEHLKHDTNWLNKWQLCFEYEKLHGKIQSRPTYKEVNIGIWIDEQKKAIQNRGHVKMNDTRQNKLMELITIKEWHENLGQDIDWMIKYNLCIEYEKSNGLITQRTKYKDVNIGFFIDKQKKVTKGQIRGTLNEDRLSKLSKSISYCSWYMTNRNECLSEFQRLIMIQSPVYTS